jgi:hypothetical protein
MIVMGITVPVAGVLLGGIYSLPAMRLTKGHEPWLSVLLGVGLAITAFGIGYLGGTYILYSAGVWALSLVLLIIARRVHGSLDGNVERFGKVHAVTLLISFIIITITEYAART